MADEESQGTRMQFPLLDVSDSSYRQWRLETLEDELKLRNIPVPRAGSMRNKRKFMALLDEFQNEQRQAPPEIAPTHLYIDPEEFDDSDEKYDTIEKLHAELVARDINIPPRPESNEGDVAQGVDDIDRMHHEACWAALTAWVHSESNIPPHDCRAHSGLSQHQQQQPGSGAAEGQEEFDRIARQRLETVAMASMPNMFGDQAGGDTSATFGTPLTDNAYSKSFEKSFHAMHRVYRQFTNLQDLVPLRAKDLALNNVIAWAHTHGPDNKLTNLLVIYRVIGVGINYVSVSQLSEHPTAVTNTPERMGKLAPNTPVFGLSLDSIEKIRRLFSSSPVVALGMSLRFPPEILAINDQQKSVSWGGEIITLDEEDEEETMFGSETVPSSRTAGGASSSAPPVTNPAPRKDTSSKDLAAAVKELAAKKSAIETKKTVGGYLREEHAAILSTEPGTLVKQGNLEVLNRMCFAHLAPTSSNSEPTRADFWGLQGPFRTQLQPAHLIAMLQSMTAVDIRMFADLYVPLGTNLAQNVVDKCAISDGLTIDSRIQPCLDIVGCESTRFENMLRNFGFVVDNLLLLCPVIREAMKSMLLRFTTHARSMLLDPTNIVTALLYVYWAYEFQAVVNQAYTMVKSGILTSADAVAGFWATKPNTTDQFQLFLQGQLYIQQHRVFPSHIKLTPPTPPMTTANPFASTSGQSPLQPQNLGLTGGSSNGSRGGGGRGNGGRGDSGRGGGDKKEKICVFYISKSHDGQKDGCQKQQCTWAHKQYTEEIVKQQWVKSVLSKNKRTLDPAKKA